MWPEQLGDLPAGHEPVTFVGKVLSEPTVSDPTNEGNKTNYFKFKDRFI